MRYYLQLFCLDDTKYGTTPELFLGPFDGIGITWGSVRGYLKDESLSPPDDHIIQVDDDVLRLSGHEGSFYSDMWIWTEEEYKQASPYWSLLPTYQHPSDITIDPDAKPSWCDTGEQE